MTAVAASRDRGTVEEGVGGIHIPGRMQKVRKIGIHRTAYMCAAKVNAAEPFIVSRCSNRSRCRMFTQFRLFAFFLLCPRIIFVFCSLLVHVLQRSAIFFMARRPYSDKFSFHNYGYSFITRFSSLFPEVPTSCLTLILSVPLLTIYLLR